MDNGYCGSSVSDGVEMKQDEKAKRLLCKPRIRPIRLKPDMTIGELVEQYATSGSFNAGRLSEACFLYGRMLEDNATIVLTLAGAMTPAGMGGALIPLIREGFVDFIISTGANIYHDLHFALDLPVHQGDYRIDDNELLASKIERIYDIFITDDLLRNTDRFIVDTVKKVNSERAVSSSFLHHILGMGLSESSPRPEDSFIAQAARYDVPIFTPSPADSAIGLNLAAMKMLGIDFRIDPDLDTIEVTAIINSSKKNGGLIIGGGAPKNFYMQTQPIMWHIFNINLGGHDYIIQITTDSPQWGGLSGATPQEAISWGKLAPEERSSYAVVYCDATIALPILVSYLLDRKISRKHRRLYKKLPEMVDDLKKKVRQVQK
jgi:deoxyhypusine synthase